MRVELTGITKRFGPLKAVDDVSLTIGEGAFFTLLGPSGCGKTTLLRTLAGFHIPDAGEIRFDGRKLPRREIETRIGEVIRSVQLGGLEDRAPSQLSGGQQQRVALARALVISPSILLMDEPLSNLDAKLRVSMREEIRRIQKGLGITTVYVTHDQEEAMAVSDRIAILNRGRIEQIGTPAEIYFRPESRFAAEFMGGSNILELGVAGYDEGSATITAAVDGRHIFVRGGKPPGGRVVLSVRPEWIRVVAGTSPGETNVLSGAVLGSTFLGSMVRYRVSGPGGTPLTIESHDPGEQPPVGDGETLWYRIPPEKPVVLER
jgi:iron(III) transport system ATP-binding protein